MATWSGANGAVDCGYRDGCSRSFGALPQGSATLCILYAALGVGMSRRDAPLFWWQGNRVRVNTHTVPLNHTCLLFLGPLWCAVFFRLHRPQAAIPIALSLALVADRECTDGACRGYTVIAKKQEAHNAAAVHDGGCCEWDTWHVPLVVPGSWIRCCTPAGAGSLCF